MSNHPNRSKRALAEARNPMPAEIVAAREAAGLKQAEAAALVHYPERSWQQWEAAPHLSSSRRMHPAVWELFRIKVGQGEPPAG